MTLIACFGFDLILNMELVDFAGINHSVYRGYRPFFAF